MIVKALRGKSFSYCTELWTSDMVLYEWPLNVCALDADDFSVSYDRRTWLSLEIPPIVLPCGYRIQLIFTADMMEHPLIFVRGRCHTHEWIDWDVLIVTIREEADRAVCG